MVMKDEKPFQIHIEVTIRRLEDDFTRRVLAQTSTSVEANFSTPPGLLEAVDRELQAVRERLNECSLDPSVFSNSEEGLGDE